MNTTNPNTPYTKLPDTLRKYTTKLPDTLRKYTLYKASRHTFKENIPYIKLPDTLRKLHVQIWAYTPLP
jgi:hypothetical protein